MWNTTTGLIVPGFVKHQSDAYDPANLLVLEATSGEGNCGSTTFD
jgi:hypothetical protein